MLSLVVKLVQKRQNLLKNNRNKKGVEDEVIRRNSTSFLIEWKKRKGVLKWEFFSGLLGNASQKDTGKVEEQLQDILIPGEQVELAFALVRDLIVFTEKRLILVDKQGMTGKKSSYKSLPYRSISRFTVETSGHFDLDAELKIWISSAMEPAEVLQFKSDRSVVEIQQALAAAVLK